MRRSCDGGGLAGMFPTQARASESFEEERFGRLGGQGARSRYGPPREDVEIAAMARIVAVEGIGVVAARTQGCHDRGSRGLLVQRGAALGAGEGAKEGHEAASIVSDEQSTFPGHITQYITPCRGRRRGGQVLLLLQKVRDFQHYPPVPAPADWLPPRLRRRQASRLPLRC